MLVPKFKPIHPDDVCTSERESPATSGNAMLGSDAKSELNLFM